MDEKKPEGKVRHQTMQVDVDELYAAMEERGLKPPPLLPGSSPSTAPQEVVVPPSAAVPVEAKKSFGLREYVLIGAAAFAAAMAAWGLARVVFSDPEPPPDPQGTMEVGPIELN